MRNYLKRILCLLSAVVLTAALVPQDRIVAQTTAAAAATSRFTDISGIPEEAAINRWADLGVVSGSNGMFKPGDAATRIEFYSFINRALGCMAKRSIAQFTDVKGADWYYPEVQLAYAAGLTNGTGPNTFGAAEGLKREMAVTIFGRIFGMHTENTSILSTLYADNTEVTYGRGYLAAFAQMGITLLKNGNFEPNSYMTRAEAVAFIDSFFNRVYTGSDFLSNQTVNGNVLIRNSGLTIERMTLNGNLILGDGVGTGNITLRNCVINGRLVIRGGGPNSINLSGTTVTNGIYIYNANCQTRLYNTNSNSKVGEVTAMTGTILEGVGSGTLYIPENAVQGSIFTLKNVALDSLNISQPGASVAIESGTIDNLRILETASQSNLAISYGAKANYTEINAENTSITGSGSIDTLYVGAPGARLSIYPRYRYILPGLHATINGVTYSGTSVSGSTSSGGASNVIRAAANMAVQPDGSKTGGTGLTLKTTAIYGGTEVTVTQDGTSSVLLSEHKRLGYWVGYFIPVPAKYQDPVVKISYSFEGAQDAAYSIPVETQNGVNGITMYIPVKAGSAGTGTLDTSINIVWGDATYENIRFYSAVPLKLAAPSASQTNSLVSYFYNTLLRSYNNITTYSGSEALKRLMLGDNPLGLDVRTFDSFTDSEKNSFTAQMYYDRSQLVSKAEIQKYLGVKLDDVGALYAINNAMSSTAVCNILGSSSYVTQLGLDTASYNQLSSSGKLAVGSALLIARSALVNTVFPNETAVVTAFTKAVSDRRKLEVGVLSTVNNASSGATMQKVLETKANADVLGIATDSDPYKALAAGIKLNVGSKISAARQFTTLDAVRNLFVSLVGTVDNPIPIKPEDDPTILTVNTNPAVLNLIVGEIETVNPIITTPSGSYGSASSVTWSVDKTTIADVNPATGLVTAKSKGAAKVTITSKADSKKKYTMMVNVVDPVQITSMTLSPSQLSISVGMQVQAKLSVVPAGGNDRIYWSSDDPMVATVSQSDGIITGLKPGFTNIMARTASNIRAVCRVFVASDDPSVIIDKSKVDNNEPNPAIVLGIDCITQLKAEVSPLTLSNTTINWSTDAFSVAEVDNQGNVRGKGYGYALITATAVGYSGISDSVYVHVKEGKYGVTISDSQISMYKNGSFQLSAAVQPKITNQKPSDVIWSVSGSPGVIKVDSNGLVTALGTGTAVVTASYSGDPTASDSCTVTVLSSTLSVTVTPNKSQSIVAGDSFFIGVAFSPTPENQKVFYTSMDPDIAVVDENGKVTGVGKGSTMINVIAQANGQAAQVAVNVSEVPLKQIIIQSSPITVARGSQTLLQVTFVPSNATDKSLIWSSNSPYNVEVTKDGYIRAIMPTATLTAIPNSSPTSFEMKDFPVTITASSASNGLISATCKVSVDERGNMGEVDKIDIRLETWVFKVGTTQNIGVVFNDNDKNRQPINTNVTWTSSNESVATVNNSGYLQTLSPGTTTITAVSEDGGKSSSKKIIVAPVGVEDIVFSPNDLDPNQNYGKWVQISTKQGGNTKTIGATVSPSGATNKNLYWYAEPANTIVTVDSNGKITAVSPGVAKVTAVAQGMSAYSDAPPSMLSPEELAASGITRTATGSSMYIYKDPNGNEIDQDKSIPVVMTRSVSNSFMVWSTPAAPENLSFLAMDGYQYLGEPFTITAMMVPAMAQVDMIEWTFTDSLGVATKATSSSLSYTYTPAVPGNLTVSCKVIMNEVTGPDTSNWPGAIPTANQLLLPAALQTATRTLQVQKRPISSVSITLPAGLTNSVYESQVFDLSVSIMPANATTKTVTWSSGDPMYAEVDQNGRVTVKSTDTAKTVTITAKPTGDENSKVAAASQTFTIRPLTAPKDMSIQSFPSTMTVGTKSSVIAVISSGVDDKYTHQGISWVSSDPSVVEISGSNTVATVTAKKAGKVTITATCMRNTTLKETCTIEVTAAAASISAPLTLNLNALGSQSSAINELLGVETYNDTLAANYTTSDADTVTVSDTGVITAVGEGEATVTATLRGETKTMRVSVGKKTTKPGEVTTPPVTTTPPVSTKAPTSIKLRISAKVEKGKTITLYPDVTPLDADGLVWSSLNESVAVVDQRGVVTGLKAGTAKIKLSSADGKISDICTVSVVSKIARPVTSFKLSRAALTLVSGQSVSILATASPSGATLSGAGWYSSNPAVAKVDVNGKVTGVSAGTAVITAVNDEGVLTASCEVTVTVKVTSVKLDKTSLSLKAGEGYKLIPSILPGNATVKTVTWKTSNKSVATVDADGNVKALKKGTATITATCDGKSVTCKVTVR